MESRSDAVSTPPSTTPPASGPLRSTAGIPQANPIDFLDYAIKSFPFRLREVRTDNGHEFQTKFHWNVEDQGIPHAYTKPRSPQLDGKVKRSHRTDQEQFYRLLTYKDDVDLE
jgi:hypothetical protein